MVRRVPPALSYKTITIKGNRISLPSLKWIMRLRSRGVAVFFQSHESEGCGLRFPPRSPYKKLPVTDRKAAAEVET
jgi:hypothetical protein